MCLKFNSFKMQAGACFNGYCACSQRPDLTQNGHLIKKLDVMHTLCYACAQIHHWLKYACKYVYQFSVSRAEATVLCVFVTV